MASGKIKCIEIGRGYGFVSCAGERDLFFHATRLVGLDFDENLLRLAVEYDKELGPDGRMRAVNVRAIGSTDHARHS